jgi:hypothetical protein
LVRGRQSPAIHRSPTNHHPLIPPIPNPQSPIPATVAAAFYVAATVALTWPVSAGLTRHIAGDFGDPLFTSWVLAWDATHLGRGLWNANIFAPQPLALAYSEHFLPQAIQVLPIYAATRNPILCYNLLFLSTFVLSAFGMFLFARELTGNDAAAIVAGLAFAFTPLRIASIPHLQVLSAAWMPFVLYGFRRYAVTRRVRPLAGAAAAWVLQNLSCGYYLFFFSPIAVAYIAWELARTGLWRDRRVLQQVAIAGAAVVAATIPFLLPYLELRRLGFSPRSLDEARRFSADVYAYLTADPNLRLWGPVAQPWLHAEGVLFPGLTILALAGVGALRRRRVVKADVGPSNRLRSIVAAVVATAWLALVVALLFDYSVRLPALKITSLSRVLIASAIAAVSWLLASPRARRAVRTWLQTPAAFFVVVTVFAIAMSFGPDVHARGRTVAATNIYALFYNYVPGFDGLRVPARYSMIAALALAALAALGVAAIERCRRARVAIVAGALILVESCAVPIPIDQNSTVYTRANLAPLPPTIAVGADAPAVYAYLAQLPASAAILELPLGEPAFDIRYMFYSTLHWRRLVNGYSGGAPEWYGVLTESLDDVLTSPDRAWDAVARSEATHLVVHEGFFKADFGRRVSDWARSHGAHEMAAFGSDHVFSLLPPP